MGDVHWIIDKLEKLSEQRDTEARPSETYAHTASKEFSYTPQLEPATDPVDKEDMATPISREELDKREELVNAKVDLRLEKFERTIADSMNQIHLELVPLKNMKANIWLAFGLVVALIGGTMAVFDTSREQAQLWLRTQQQMDTASRDLLQASIELQKAVDQVKGSGAIQPPNKSAPQPAPAIPTDPPAP